MADLFAFVRVIHHLIKRNDRKPTPSHPMNRRNMFSVEVNIIMFSRKIIKSRKKFFGAGSLPM